MLTTGLLLVWIHPDNLLEVQTIILRHLPALLYSERSAKELDGTADPTITSLYFDNAKFGLYMKKVEHQVEAPSLRLRWYGQLSSRPELYMERKVVHENGVSEERKFTLKDKYVKPFLDGDYHMEKTVDKMARQGRSEAEIASFKETVASIQDFIKKNSLEPVLRANYRRMAYQNPADDRVRISIDTDIAFVREDTLDSSRPCRDPASWHRTDIDNANMSFPFSNINRSEVSKFPYAVLEIKLRESHSHKRPAWIEELMGGHLVYAAPRFSKFVHGVASLFEDYVNSLPLWLNDLASDITRDPEAAYREDAARRAARAEEDMVVGSFIGGSKASRSLQHLPPGKASPVAKSYPSTTGVPGELAASSAAQGARARSVDASILASEAAAAARSQRRGEVDGAGEEGSGIGQRKEQQQQRQRGVGGAFGYGTISSFIPAFSLSRYSQAMRRRAEAKSGGVRVELPEGVVEPSSWLKNEGPLKIEPKAWLANERTSLKWLHIVMLLGALATALFVSAGEDTIAAAMGIACLGIAIFAGSWSFYMHDVRRRMIIERSGKDFDNPVGPLVVSGALMVALILNLVFQVCSSQRLVHFTNGVED